MDLVFEVPDGGLDGDLFAVAAVVNAFPHFYFESVAPRVVLHTPLAHRQSEFEVEFKLVSE